MKRDKIKFGYDEQGNRIFSKFTGLPIQPLSYHIMMVLISLVFCGLIFLILNCLI